jgi:valyl-tRNA synthetase
VSKTRVEDDLAAMMQKMAKAEWLDTLDGDLTVETIQDGSLYIPSNELSDPEEEKKKLQAEKERLEKELARSKGILSNEKFLAKAPTEKVAAEKEKQAAYEKQYQVIIDRLSVLNK